MVGTLINNMTQCEDGTLHALTDEQVIETALAAPPEGACVTFPWLLDRPAECLDLHPSVLGYAAAVRLLQDGANTFHAGAPQRHVMAVRSDQGCFAVLWELSVPRLHTLGELEAAAVAAAAVAAVAAAPVAPSAPVPVPAPPAASSAAAPSTDAHHARLLARVHTHMHSTG